MKLTLAYQVYNKEKWIKSLLESWLDNLSGNNEYEVIIVFDDCKDNSPKIVEKVLQGRKLDYQFLYADDEFEIYCNDMAFKQATGDFIIFIQDDNWMYDKNWDDTLVQIISKVEKVGAVGLLAGLEMKRSKGIKYQRIEVNRPHKGENFQVKEDFDLAVWSVDSINRPFGIFTNLLREIGGLDFAFRPTCGDDLDLSLKLLKKGYINIYIPFDVKNLVASNSTMNPDFIRNTYNQAFTLNLTRHGDFLRQRLGMNLIKLFSMENQSGILRLGKAQYPGVNRLRMRLARAVLPIDYICTWKKIRGTPGKILRVGNKFYSGIIHKLTKE